MSTKFARVNPRTPFPQLEEETLKFWQENDIFAKSLEQREGAPEFVVYEGPPTANGNPGIHHAQARAYKDLFPRYKTMCGCKVRRKAGWDCHGLPVEIEVEKKLGFSGKPAIEKYGIEPFNKECRSSVMTYEGAWRKLTERIAYWTDLDHPYMTMTNDYVESVWWSLKELWKKNLLYLGYKVVPFCARCGTPLSSAEAGSAYKDVKDPSLFVLFPLAEPEKLDLPENSALLVWTTTPWTLPGNTAACVHPDMDYVAIKYEDRVIVLAECLIGNALGTQDGVYEILKHCKGKDLEGTKYKAPYPWYDFGEKVGHRVVTGDFVTAEDGTGIVHIAPAFGADDLEMSRKHGLPVVHPVATDGHFIADAQFLSGKWFKDADPLVIKDLKERGLLFRIKEYLHSYPHCWRCRTPLLYYATDSWYINNTSLKERLIEKNQEIDWHPAHIKNGRYGDWLDNLIDWAISRTRYWGTPLPIWTCSCGHKDIVGSFEELGERSIDPLDVKAEGFDPHRPYVDNIRIRCEKCGSEMHRVPDVIDCWYDSGSMPFAQFHYPFENKELFKASFPADFICEGLDQTRGWFNSLHQLGVMLFDSIAFKSVICHGLVLDKDGEKMSKSRGNVVNPWDVINSEGADAIRWYLYTSAPPENSRRFSDKIVEESSKHLSTWWNTWQFFVMNVNAADIDLSAPADSSKLTELDRWILARTNLTVKQVSDALDVFDPTKAARALEAYVDDLSNWYVRRSRRRFWDSDPAAYRTLYDCLVTLAKLQAPFTPFMADFMWRSLVPPVDSAAPISVHLADWPKYDEALNDAKLLKDCAAVIDACSVGRSARSVSKQKVRQPLAEALIGVRNAEEREGIERFAEHIKEELNVKKISFLKTGEKFLDYNVKPNLPKVGPRYGKLLGKIRAVLQSSEANDIAIKSLAGEDITFSVGDTDVTLAPEDLLIEICSPEGYAASESQGLVVAISTEVTDELRLEGLARDVIRNIQELRKQADFDISDRIDVWCANVWDELKKAIGIHKEVIMDETLSLTLSFTEPPADAVSAEVEFSKGGPKFTIGVRRAVK